MAYRSGGYSRRSSGAGFGRRRSTSSRGYGPRRRQRAPARARSTAARGQQVVRLVIEQAPASGISRANNVVLAKMNPPPGKAKF